MEKASWRVFGVELAVLLSIAVAVTLPFTLLIYPALGLPGIAPVPVRTAVLLFVVWWLIRRQGEGWADFGLRRPENLGRIALITVGLLLGKLFIIQPLSDMIRSFLALSPPDYSFFAHIQGNVPALVLWLVIAWGVGGFGEEMLMRGYLMNRISRLFGGTGWAWTLAVVSQALLFGVAHTYVGLTGIVGAGFTALTFGLFYLLAGRNLWPVIIVHGLWDTLGVILIYLNGIPST